MKPSKTQRKKTVGWSDDELFSSKVAELPSFQSPTSEKKPVEPVEVLFRFFFVVNAALGFFGVPFLSLGFGTEKKTTKRRKQNERKTKRINVTLPERTVWGLGVRNGVDAVINRTQRPFHFSFSLFYSFSSFSFWWWRRHCWIPVRLRHEPPLKSTGVCVASRHALRGEPKNR